MMSKLKLNITMSIDGFVAGPDQSPEHPLGVGGEELHDWLVPLKAFRESHGEEGGEVNASTPFAEDILGERSARVDLAAFLAVALAERLERDQPIVKLLTADPERMLWRLVRAGDEAVDRHRDVQLQLAHRSSLCRHARRTAQRVRSHRSSQSLTKLPTSRSTQSS